MQVKIDDEIRQKPIEWLAREDEIMQFLRNAGMVTVGDAINRQAEIPPNYWHEIKRKLIFNI